MVICKNCGAEYEGKYCNYCGQKAYTDKDKSVRHIIEEAFHFITHFEGSFFTTLKTVVRYPGRLSIDYSDGRRKKYFKPVSFYLMLVVIYLIFPVAQGLNMELKNYKALHFIGNTISKQQEQKIAKRGVTEEELSDRFKEKSHTTSKVLLFLFIPFSAALIFGLYPGRKRLWFDNMILATEVNIFYLLALYLVIPIIYLIIRKVAGVSAINDDAYGLLLTILFGTYVAVLFRRVFRSAWWVAFPKGILFSLLHAFVLLWIYKVLVFEITMALL